MRSVQRRDGSPAGGPGTRPGGRVRRAGPAGWAPAALGLVLAVAAAGGLLLGCGPGPYLAAAAAGAAAGEEGRGGGGSPPVLELAPALGRSELRDDWLDPNARQIAVPFRIVQPRSLPVAVEPRWRLADEPPGALRAATIDRPGSTRGLASAPDPGVEHAVVWRAGEDLAAAGRSEAEVVLQLVPRLDLGAEGGGEVAGVAKELRLRAGNVPPGIALEPLASPQRGTVLTAFTVTDPASDRVTVRLYAQELDGAGDPIGPGVLVQDRLTLRDEVTLEASPLGVRGGVVWDSVEVRPGAELFGQRLVQARLVLVAYDQFGDSSVTSTAVTLDNR
ncbi:MAG: hypothetical protein KatS3mg102_0923 [Planctomycetota bacterium]|nr:MAG: hypothetical protein KatS3mg102_0923 [Planctomycetota bacterium]